jgi:hypothetical protein
VCLSRIAFTSDGIQQTLATANAAFADAVLELGEPEQLIENRGRGLKPAARRRQHRTSPDSGA